MNEQATHAAPKSRGMKPALFVVVQVAFLVAAGLVIARRTAQVDAKLAIPAFREVPLQLEFGYDDPLVASDDQLRAVLTKLAPRFSGQAAKINHIDHALRFWGVEATFPTIPDAVSGESMRQLLTDHRLFIQLLGSDAEPLLVAGPEGVRVAVQQGLTTSSHVDHTMATLAEVGTPADFPIYMPLRGATFGDMVRQALVDFRLNQREYEWSVLTFALMLEPNEGWYTSEGQRIDFDLLAKRIMRQDMPEGVCFGNHRLFTLAMLLRVDEIEGRPRILSDEGRASIEQYLTQMTARLVRHQHALGFWNADWPNRAPAAAAPTGNGIDGLTERILATGHALEWWAIAPESLHPPRGVVRRAGQYLANTIEGLEQSEVIELYTYLSHAGRALALWRKVLPADVPLLAIEAPVKAAGTRLGAQPDDESLSTED